jgi:tetratricopeptide (TPR) repeat protein
MQQFAEEQGEDERSRWVAAESRYRAARVGAFLGRYEQAEKDYRIAVRLYEKLVADSPTMHAYRGELALSETGLGDLLVGLGKSDEAEKAYRQALALREKLAGDFPAMPEYRVQVADSCINIGNLRRDRGQPQAALDWYGKAIALLSPILAQDAQVPSARRFLRNAHWGRAMALGQLGRHAEAAKDWLRAAELDLGRMRPYFRLQHCLALAHQGEHRAAVKGVEKLLRSSSDEADTPSGPLCYDAACVYALSVAAVKDDAKLWEGYAVHALALLRQAQQADFFKDPKQIDNMRKDTDLDYLRQREDFKKFLGEFK